MRRWDGPWADNQKNKVRTDLKNDNQKKLQTKPRRERPERGEQRSSPGLAHGPGTSSSQLSRQPERACPGRLAVSSPPQTTLPPHQAYSRERATRAQGLSRQGQHGAIGFSGPLLKMGSRLRSFQTVRKWPTHEKSTLWRLHLEVYDRFYNVWSLKQIVL